MTQKVIWKLNGEVVEWKPARTPALGWNTLTLLEALADSTKTLLSMGNIEGAKSKINDLLKILRGEIEEQKKLNDGLLQRCEFRETKRTRCNKYPTVGAKNGMHLCSKHFKQVKEHPKLHYWFDELKAIKE